MGVYVAHLPADHATRAMAVCSLDPALVEAVALTATHTSDSRDAGGIHRVTHPCSGFDDIGIDVELWCVEQQSVEGGGDPSCRHGPALLR